MCGSRSLSCITNIHSTHHPKCPTVKSYTNHIYFPLFSYIFLLLTITFCHQKSSFSIFGPYGARPPQARTPLPFERYPTSQGFLPQQTSLEWLLSLLKRQKSVNSEQQHRFVGIQSGQRILLIPKNLNFGRIFLGDSLY